jgi:hypothetical protein
MGRSPASAIIALLLLLLVPASAAAAADPPFIGWTAALPDRPLSHVPTNAEDCTSGKPQCIDAVLREMRRRFAPLAESCDHDAVFALTYLRTTEEYQRSSLESGFYEDVRFVNHEDAVFAATYFAAYDAWHAGDRARTPLAWRIAFDAAAGRQVSAAGNQALGINAHVLHDLPFVLASIGLVAPDGRSRKRDHDKVNAFLNRVNDTLRPEIAARFDPTMDDADLPGQLDDVASFQIIPTWRELAWRNAERLVSAPTPAARAQVAASIEAYAASQAELIRTSLAYPLGVGRAARQAFCAANHG